MGAISKIDGLPLSKQPALIKAAESFNWRPSTLARRIEKALTNPAEQSIYLAVLGDLKLHPESMNKLLRRYLQYTAMTAQDILDGGSPKLKSFLEFLAATLELLRLQKRDYPNISISISNAAEIVLTYGPDEVDNFLSMVEVNLYRIGRRCGITERTPYDQAMNKAIWYLLKFVLPDNRAKGKPDPLMIFDEPPVNKETPDIVSMDHESLAKTETGRKLKALGVL